MSCIPYIYDVSILSRKECTLYQATGSGIVSANFTRGRYLIELWGASGGNASMFNSFSLGGSGGYTSGVISLTRSLNAYFCIGTKGESQNGGTGGKGGYNGGGNAGNDNHDRNSAGGGGGGATDMRLSPGECEDPVNIKSRIMVAGGGGGSASYVEPPGHAGGLIGNAGGMRTEVTAELPRANQTFGYQFGFGENGYDGNDPSGGGAGGYYGGITRMIQYLGTGGGGGSSFISGYEGCVAITKDGTPSTSNVHFSKYKFTSGNMINGGVSMPSPVDKYTYEALGHVGDEFVRITNLGMLETWVYKINSLHIFNMMIFIFLFSLS